MKFQKWIYLISLNYVVVVDCGSDKIPTSSISSHIPQCIQYLWTESRILMISITQ